MDLDIIDMIDSMLGHVWPASLLYFVHLCTWYFVAILKW